MAGCLGFVLVRSRPARCVAAASQPIGRLIGLAVMPVWAQRGDSRRERLGARPPRGKDMCLGSST